MSAAMAEVPAFLRCSCCPERVGGTWAFPLGGSPRDLDRTASEAAVELARDAKRSGWLVHGGVALCPSCLERAIAGEASLPTPATVSEAVDGLAIARKVARLRKERTDVQGADL